MNAITPTTLILLASLALPVFAQEVAPPEGVPNEPPGIVKFEVPLSQLSNLPILAGYEQNTPDQNLEAYALPVCQALGYDDAQESTTSFAQAGAVAEVTVYDRGAAGPRVTAPEHPGMIGILTRLVCSKIAGS